MKYYVVDPGEGSKTLHVVAADSEVEAAKHGRDPHEMPGWLFTKWRPLVDPARKGKVAEFHAEISMIPSD